MNHLRYLIRNYPVALVLGLALLLRFMFLWFGAPIYFGSATPWIQGDSLGFLGPGKFLIEIGSFTVEPHHPRGVVGRLPGYPLLLYFFQLIFGTDPYIVGPAVAIFQVGIDVLSCWLIYRITYNLTAKPLAALFAGLLYACYPFIIIWTAVVYSESISVFLTLLAIHLMQRRAFKGQWLWIGAVLALGFFFRPQLMFLALAIGASIVLSRRPKTWFRQGVLLGLGFMLVYMWWPIRNYAITGEIVLVRDISSMRPWQDDVYQFKRWMTSMQVEWDPQFTQIVQGDSVAWPPEASVHNRADIDSALALTLRCGDGFASFRGLPRLREPCTDAAAARWRALFEEQRRLNPLHAYGTVSLQYFGKAFFKNSLASNWKSPDRSGAVVLASKLLFGYRSILLMLGIAGFVVLIRQRKMNATLWGVLFFFLSTYGFICIHLRHLEMRYLLNVDVLLLIPAALMLSKLLERKGLAKVEGANGVDHPGL